MKFSASHESDAQLAQSHYSRCIKSMRWTSNARVTALSLDALFAPKERGSATTRLWRSWRGSLTRILRGVEEDMRGGAGCDRAEQLHAHHVDYSKPHEVVWVCRWLTKP
jgi:hypothetical protein